ncbi:MAG: hypothetical protein ACLTEE_02240 [Anaerobutyricum hallii]
MNVQKRIFMQCGCIKICRRCMRQNRQISSYKKSITRRVNNENNNVRRKILREKNAVLRENVQALKEDKKTLQERQKETAGRKEKNLRARKKATKEIDNIKQSKAYRLGNKLLWLPRKVVKEG